MVGLTIPLGFLLLLAVEYLISSLAHIDLRYHPFLEFVLGITCVILALLISQMLLSVLLFYL